MSAKFGGGAGADAGAGPFGGAGGPFGGAGGAGGSDSDKPSSSVPEQPDID